MKIAIISAVWQRPEVFKLFAQGLHSLIKAFPETDFQVFIAGSEGQTSQSMVEAEGFNYNEIPNKPLALKHNSACLKAKEWGPDFTLCLGSDDILSPETFSLYLKRLEEHPTTDFIGLTDYYFYDLTTDRALYWGGYTDHRKGHVCGAGILLSKQLLDIWNWKPWHPKFDHILDDAIWNKLKMTFPCKKYLFSLKENGVYAIDIKSLLT